MTNSMKSENKLDGASNFRAWKTRIDLILAKNKVLDIVKRKIVKPEFEDGKEKELQNVAAMEKFKDVDINSMSIIVDSIKDHLHLPSRLINEDLRCPNKSLLSQKHWTSYEFEE